MRSQCYRVSQKIILHHHLSQKKMDITPLKIGAVLLVFEPFKNIDFQGSYETFSMAGVRLFLTQRSSVLYIKYQFIRCPIFLAFCSCKFIHVQFKLLKTLIVFHFRISRLLFIGTLKCHYIPFFRIRL